MPSHLRHAGRVILYHCRRFGVYVGFDQRSYSTPSPVSTGMGDRVRGSAPGDLATYLSIKPATHVNLAWPSLRG